MQNAAARLLTRRLKQEHILLILILVFAYKSLKGLAPTYLSDLIQLHVPSRSLRSADLMLLVVPRVRLKDRGDHDFAVVAAAILWNTLPVSVRMVTTLSAFKTSLKTHFYPFAFNSV